MGSARYNHYLMHTLVFDHFQPAKYAFAVLYTDVQNSADIKNLLIQASKGTDDDRESINFAFIDASLITSTLHLQTAVHQSLIAEAQQTLRTKTIHSEILWALNPTNNITEAIRRYGVSNSSKSLIVLRITDSESWPEKGLAKIDAIVKGTRVPFTKLADITDWASIKKHYKLDETDNDKVHKVVTSSVAMKSVMN